MIDDYGQSAIRVHEALRNVFKDEKKAEEFKERMRERFPFSTYFKG